MNIRHVLGFDDRWLIALGIPLLGFLVPVLFDGASPAQLGFAEFLPHFIVSALYSATYWFTSRATVAFWRKRKPGRPQTAVRVCYTLLSLIVLVMIVEVACRYALSWGNLLRAAAFEYADRGFWRTAPVSLVLVLGVTAFYEAMYFFTLYRKAELEGERLLRAQVETQLAALRKQVDPHFLFNSLNTLATIIPEDPAAAVVFTERLSAAYRRLLEWRSETTVTLAEELAALNDYVHLLAVRFEGRFVITIDIPAEVQARRIVPLSLQTLVENTVKHNVASRAQPLQVRIWTEGTSVLVCNRLSPKPATGQQQQSTGVGLQNLADSVRYLELGELKVEQTAAEYCVTVPTGAVAKTSSDRERARAPEEVAFVESVSNPS